MADFSFTAKECLKSIIRTMSKDVTPFVKNPGKDFSRNSPITFSDTLHFLLALQGNCLDKEMLHFFSYSPFTPTSSAMIQRRSKLKLSALEHIFLKFSDSYPASSRFEGYHLIAADSSKFALPENRQEPLCHVKNPNSDKGFNELQLNALYHLNTGIFRAIQFQEIRNANEHSALSEMLKMYHFPKKSIIIADRGYESYNTFAHIENMGLKYVIRGKQGNAGILFGLNVPDLDEFDIEYSFTITKRNTNKIKEHPALYKRIRSNARFDFFSEECPEYQMNLRVVKLKITDTLSEILFTNLSKEEMSAKDLREIYHRRWEIETAFSQLKYALGAAATHSKKAEYVLQELYAKVIMHNFCKIIVYHTSFAQNPSRKYDYQINMNIAVDICMKFWCNPDGTSLPEVERLLLKYRQPIRKGRSFRRTSSKKPVPYFTYRIA